MNNLKTVLENLKSDKIKERQEALGSIREVFTDRVVAGFHVKRDGESQPKVWLPVFQALFNTVTIEKSIAKKKSTAKSGASSSAALRRLSDAASIIRWLVERSVQYMNKKVALALFQHLMQMLPTDRSTDARLFAPVALDYAKALKCLVGYPPHLEHLDESMWVTLVEMSFNVILDDPIGASFAVQQEESIVNEIDSDMYVDDGELAEGPDSDDLPTTSKKRPLPRNERTPTPMRSPQKSQARLKLRTSPVVSLEQIEFASILSIMISSPIAPILSEKYPGLASGILVRLERFLNRYPTDSSLLHDFLTILSSTLRHVSLNKTYEVAQFARSTWSSLVGLWGTKDKRMKEGLIVVLRNLLPYTTCPVYMEDIKLPSFQCTKEIGRLRDLLDNEAESRWGVDGLSLEALRLQIRDTEEGDHVAKSGGVFIATTFRAGWNFDAEQALSWAILELHADCQGILFQLSETMDSTDSSAPSRRETKRTKILDPISTLLESLHSPKPVVRSYRLQTLLFFIDRHWHTVHDELKGRVVQILLQYVGVDDTTMQSWVFLNFAAIAYAEGSKVIPRHGVMLDPLIWDSIWTHATRRANVPAICRAACHAGQAALVTNSKTSDVLLPTHRILLEIETLAKDMDVQGPAYPYDSVCIFLSNCLTIASQDARLYRMQLEDKVLSWLVDTWKITGNRMKMTPNMVQDVLLLLEAICGLSKKTYLVSRPLLPQSQIVESVVEDNKVKIIQDYVLYAKVPPFVVQHVKSPRSGRETGNKDTRPERTQLVPPRGRERKVSAFLLKTLEALSSEWDSLNDTNSHPTAESVRRALDMAIISLLFEASLILNGTASNRQVTQNASKLMTRLVALLIENRWTTTEKLLIAHALEVLVNDDELFEEEVFREALSPPGPNSGIKTQTLQNLLRRETKDKESRKALRLQFLRIFWQNADGRDALDLSSKTLRRLLSHLLQGVSTEVHDSSIDVDEKDGFGPIRTTTVQSLSTNIETGDHKSIEHIFQICVGFISYGQFLQSHSAEAARDKELTQLVLNGAGSNPERFSILCPIFFNTVRKGILHLPIKYLAAFFDEFGSLLEQYLFSRSERFHRVVLDLLTSSLGVWDAQDAKAEEVYEQFRQLCSWFSIAHNNNNIRSWSLRDAFSRFLDRYLSQDPDQQTWLFLDGTITEENSADYLPDAILPRLNSDPDMRVRFRVAVVNTRLFSRTGDTAFYNRISAYLSKDVDMFEHMLTRMLALGNIMVVSATIRRGAYWHLLEACIHSIVYSKHIEAILVGTSERLGIVPLSSLFEVYASQMAFAVYQAQADFMNFPPNLLGYRNKKQCAEATFRELTPTNIINNDTKTFTTHCKILQKSLVDGLQECFPDIVGFLLVFLHDNLKESAYSSDEIDRLVMERLAPISDFNKTCQENVDGIIIKILRSLGDQDCSENGPIISALRRFDSQAVPTFRVLNKFCLSDTFQAHSLNLPSFPTEIVLQSIAWLSSKFPLGFNKATTYHVIQGLMNEIHRTPLVSEQARLINALMLWMACRHDDIRDRDIYETLVQGATLLLSQWDLARSAQSILDAVFRTYRKSGFTDPHLPDLLIRICSIAHEYASNDENRTVSDLGISLVDWIEGQVFEMSISGFESLTLRALPAWPREPSAQLLPLFHQTTLQSLASVLEDPQIISNKFRIVRRFKDQAIEYGLDDNDDDFSKTYFWRLKDCMPPPELLQEEDVEAFANLLTLHHGQISSFDIEQPDSKGSRNRHIRNYRKQTSGSKTYPAREAITLELLQMLESDDPLRVIAAYSTLRLITAVPFHEDAQWQVPSEYRTKLDLFRAYRRTPKMRPLVDIRDLLRSDEYTEAASNFGRWISLFATLLTDSLSAIDPFFGQLSSIFSTDITFAEDVLPILVVTLLNCHRDTAHDSLSHKKILSEYFTVILSSDSTDVHCIRSIVDVVLHSRSFAPPLAGSSKDYLAYNKWVDLDFTLLARGAILCGAYTTALLFVELAAERKSQNTQGHSVVEHVLYDIYAHIDEPDGFYGIKTQDLHQFLIKRFHHEQQWDKAFRFHGAALEAGISGKGNEEGLVNSFHSFGFDHLAVDILRNISTDSSATKHSPTASYQLGWRTETWDLPDQAQDAASAPLYRSLRSVHRERDPRTVENTVRFALFQEMGHLRSLGSENLTEIRAVSRDLMCLSQIQEWTQDHKHESKPDVVLDNWTKFVGLDTRFEFGDLEAIMATRVSLIRSIRQREERRLIGNLVTPLVRGLRDIEKRCFVRLSEAARENGQIQVALNSIVRAQQLDMNTSAEVSEEFANVLWLQKEERSAVQFLQGLIEKPDVVDTPPDLGRKALRLARLGKWTSDAYLEKPSVIWERYFSPAIDLLDSIELGNPASEASQSTIYRECAMFAERQYHAASKSPDAIRWKVYVERKKQEIEYRSAELAILAKSQLPSKEPTDRQKSLKSDQDLAHKLLSEDSAMFNKHSILRDAFLQQAIDMHSRCLGTSSDFDNDSAIRFCSLWFANFDDLSILDVVIKGLDRIPSHKLVFLAHQLTARVANSSLSPQQDNLQKLVLRMGREHPFHILYQVYCLSDHSQVNDVHRRQSGRVSSQSTQATQTERGTAASNILDRLRDDPVTRQRVQDIERLCDAYLQWAKHPITPKNSAFQTQRAKPPYDIPPSMKLLAIQNLKVPVTTSRMPVDPTMMYKDCEWIQGYERKFTTAGGINLPKISVCRGSNGNSYKQLFKGEGKDDLRQDAVMEQVFDLVNSILRRDRETRRRQLRVRDYKVIPIASQAGLLEFVVNTAPMRDWLMSAHRNYRPQDEKPNDAVLRLKKVQTEQRHNPDKQLEVFLQIRKRLQPVMRHYFTEKHKTPLSWFQMRLNYVRSVATTSIVGHVLGLGDRHTSNILLDNVTGDVIHIDLGIAFDQGKLLGFPERVPFRMTADMVDGMGISGTSGVFQRCAEETLRVLREESGVILTVLEVFKHDPLHSWTASEIKVKQAQDDAPVTAPLVNDTTRYNLGIGIDMTSGTAEEAADRALSSVARKLDKSLSVESTVNELIAEATDPMNLATLFYGWAPYL